MYMYEHVPSFNNSVEGAVFLKSKIVNGRSMTHDEYCIDSNLSRVSQNLLMSVDLVRMNVYGPG